MLNGQYYTRLLFFSKTACFKTLDGRSKKPDMNNQRNPRVCSRSKTIRISSNLFAETEACGFQTSGDSGSASNGTKEGAPGFDFACAGADEIAQSVARSLSDTMETKDPCTAAHQMRVSEIATRIAAVMGLSEERIAGVRLGGMIHDLGKIFVPDPILCKPGRLSSSEFEIVKRHARLGHEVLKRIKFPFPLATIVFQHHERIDGSGYPCGLAGEAILLESKILSVADVVDTISSNRPYRLSMGKSAALAEIAKYKGIHFDPETVEACFEIFGEDSPFPPDDRFQEAFPRSLRATS